MAERPRLTLLRPRVAHVVERAWACSEHRFLVPHVYFLLPKSNNRLKEESAVPALPPMPLDAYVKEEEVQVAPRPHAARRGVQGEEERSIIDGGWAMACRSIPSSVVCLTPDTG